MKTLPVLPGQSASSRPSPVEIWQIPVSYTHLLTALLDHYLDTDALADGLPLYVSLYPTEGGMQDIIDCIRRCV